MIVVAVLAVLAVAGASPVAGAKWFALRVVRDVRVDSTGLAKPATALARSGAACRPVSACPPRSPT